LKNNDHSNNYLNNGQQPLSGAGHFSLYNNQKINSMSKKKAATAQQTNGTSMYENFKKDRAKERAQEQEFNEEFMQQLKDNGLTREMLEAIGQLTSLEQWSGELNDHIILVSGVMSGRSIGFHFIKLEKGNFGRIIVRSQYQEQLGYFESEEYKDTQKLNQRELSEFLGRKEWFVYDADEQTISKQEIKPQPSKQEAKEPVKDKELELFHYSASSIALFGDTTAYKEMLYEDPFNGVPNRRLTHPATNKKTFGWIFSNDQETIEAVEKKFSVKIKGKKKQVA
jgi:hypothetical protein